MAQDIKNLISTASRFFHLRLTRVEVPVSASIERSETEPSNEDLLEIDIEAQIEALPHSTLERAMVYLREIAYLYDVQHYEYMVRFIQAHQDWTLSDLFEFLNA